MCAVCDASLSLSLRFPDALKRSRSLSQADSPQAATERSERRQRQPRPAVKLSISGASPV